MRRTKIIAVVIPLLIASAIILYRPAIWESKQSDISGTVTNISESHLTPEPTPKTNLQGDPQSIMSGLLADLINVEHTRPLSEVKSIEERMAELAENPQAYVVLISQAKSLLETSAQTSERAVNRLLHVLGKVKSAECATLLLEFIIRDDVNSELREEARNALLEITGEYNGKYAEELCPAMVEVWNRHGNQPKAASAIASALARVGGLQCVTQLVGAIALGDGSVASFNSLATSKEWAAYDSFLDIDNPNAIPILSEIMSTHSPDSVAVLAAGDALANMPREEAAKELLQFVLKSSIDLSTSIDKWYADPKYLFNIKIMDEAVTSMTFSNKINRAALKEALSVWRKARGI